MKKNKSCDAAINTWNLNLGLGCLLLAIVWIALGFYVWGGLFAIEDFGFTTRSRWALNIVSFCWTMIVIAGALLCVVFYEWKKME